MARYVLNNKRNGNRDVEAHVAEHMKRLRVGVGDTETRTKDRLGGINEVSGELVAKPQSLDDFEIALDYEGNARGYLADESGQISVVDIPVVDGHPIDEHGSRYEFTGEVRGFRGWPSADTAVVTERLSIAIC